ncbi:hypothetical protein [Streptomyces sp. XH2]|uniref:hypothetical protein n=1 Tax=Streptomyces sp. XH2 TaxID=3412483 RepID=UPI003C7BAEEE
MADTYDFPASLRQAQLELHQVTADLAELRRLVLTDVPLPAKLRCSVNTPGATE